MDKINNDDFEYDEISENELWYSTANITHELDYEKGIQNCKNQIERNGILNGTNDIQIRPSDYKAMLKYSYWKKRHTKYDYNKKFKASYEYKKDEEEKEQEEIQKIREKENQQKEAMYEAWRLVTTKPPYFIPYTFLHMLLINHFLNYVRTTVCSEVLKDNELIETIRNDILCFRRLDINIGDFESTVTVNDRVYDNLEDLCNFYKLPYIVFKALDTGIVLNVLHDSLKIIYSIPVMLYSKK